MSETYCKYCKEIIDILRDKYFRVTVENDTYLRDIQIIYRFHRKCWLELIGGKNK